MLSRRSFLVSSGVVSAGAGLGLLDGAEAPVPLSEFGYGDVELAPEGLPTQLDQSWQVVMSVPADALLKPWRLRAGMAAPGPEMGGWYDELPLHKTESGGHGFAPAHSFGQWISALSRAYAVHRDAAMRAWLERTLALYEPTISGRFYQNFRFPAYVYDKMVIGLSDAEQFGGIARARQLLDRTTDVAEPHLPPQALNRDEPQRRWRESVGENTGNDYTWDESYTLPENLDLAAGRGAGERYRKLAKRFLLDETWFTPLSQGQNVLANHHAYSFCNSLSSAMQAYLTGGSSMHLAAARQAFDMIEKTQSFATGGWGPNESFVRPEQGELSKSLTTTHHGFETPCGSYAHLKLTRYLLRVTREGRFGDSMERVLYNTVLGAKPLEKDGRAFYYSDYHEGAKKVYFPDRWPCCAGTLPQVAADLRLLPYLRDGNSVYVNLYLPSTLRWTEAGGAQMSLTQHGEYPLEGRIEFVLRTSRVAEVALLLRVPGWAGASGARIAVNGAAMPLKMEKGFARIERRWADGDRVQLEMALPMRLEAVDGANPKTVALLRGPLVLFGLGDSGGSRTRASLLGAQPGTTGEWRVQSASGALVMRPFWALGDETYRTYFRTA